MRARTLVFALVFALVLALAPALATAVAAGLRPAAGAPVAFGGELDPNGLA